MFEHVGHAVARLRLNNRHIGEQCLQAFLGDAEQPCELGPEVGLRHVASGLPVDDRGAVDVQRCRQALLGVASCLAGCRQFGAAALGHHTAHLLRSQRTVTVTPPRLFSLVRARRFTFSTLNCPFPALFLLEPAQPEWSQGTRCHPTQQEINERRVNPVALDLFSPLKVVSWASVHADCPMRYEITNPSELVIIFGSDQNEFELSLDGGALRTLVQLSTKALDKMDTY